MGWTGKQIIQRFSKVIVTPWEGFENETLAFGLSLSPTRGGGPQRPALAELAIAPKRIYILI